MPMPHAIAKQKIEARLKGLEGKAKILEIRRILAELRPNRDVINKRAQGPRYAHTVKARDPGRHGRANNHRKKENRQNVADHPNKRD